ncbi:MAG TPA: GNAT family N-acetyltransferase [Ilumatobacter sp.]|nr:GNAT family N-acetyltransferase [Ilumatobacter sp.]
MPRRRPFRLQTERLTLRMLARDDITDFTRYRNRPEVARYQEWSLPYTRDLAHELVDEMDAMGQPEPGAWAQLAMDRDGRLVGDFAVWIDPADELAMIGYTVAPEHQGHAYAVEAAEAVIEWLFARGTIHRVAATIDPRNMASARVLERCGFEYVGTARSAAWSRGEWTDDARFSLLAEDWRTWRSRPTHPPRSVRFVPVDATNVDAVCALDIAHSQRRFVRTISESIARAAHPPLVDGEPVEPWYRAIEADGELVGFVMLAHQPGRAPRLWQLLVDRRHPRRGIATRAVGAVARHVAAGGSRWLDASFVDEPGGPEVFYDRLGFQRSGEAEPGGDMTCRAATADVIRLVELLIDRP